MKVALVLTGHLRCFDTIWEETKRNFIDIINPDIFAFTWNDSMGNYLPPLQTQHPDHHPGYNLESPPVLPEYLESVRERINPKVFITESYMDHDAKFQAMVESWRWVTGFLDVPAGGHRPKGCLGMVWSRSKIIQAKAAYEREHNIKYDAVVVTRWDVYHRAAIHNVLHVPDVINAAGAPDRHPWDYWTSGPNNLIDIWGQQWDGMQELIDINTFNTSPHLWQTNWFAHKNVPWAAIHNGTGIAR